MLSPERVELLQRQWVALLGSFDVAPADAYPVFDDLVAAHSEPHRHYHTLEHVAEVLKVAGKLADRCEDVRVVQLAVWFHDAVYDPTAKDNEDRSAALASTRLGPLLRGDVVADVSVLIILSAHRQEVKPGRWGNAAVLLDADLAILASNDARYRRYAADVRKEYAHVPDDLYRTGRAAVLKQFLGRDRIFLTDRMHAEGEEPARRNLQAEIDALTLTHS